MIDVPPPEDEYPEVLGVVVQALASGNKKQAAFALSAIAYRRRDIERRPPLSRELQARVFVRDKFSCRYCGGRLILTAIMELVSVVFPDAFPFHPNWKGGHTHPAVLSRSAVVDHIEPGSVGGDWLAENNLVTACWPCNSRKSDISLARLGWELRPIPPASWDGLTSHYRSLWESAGHPKPRYHQSWMSALSV